MAKATASKRSGKTSAAGKTRALLYALFGIAAAACLVAASCDGSQSADSSATPSDIGGAAAAAPVEQATSAPSSAAPTQVPAAPTQAAPAPPTQAPAPPPTQPTAPPAAPQQASTCGAPANPWGYNFCGGSLIYSPPSDFCNYFGCVASFWKSINGYVDECVDGTYSHSGGRSGACSHHGGEQQALYGP